MDSVFILVILVGTAVALVIAVLMASNRRAGWEEYALTRRLSFRDGGMWSRSRISGLYQGIPVSLFTFSRGSGNNRRTYTRAAACFNLEMPAGLHVAKRGFMSKLFGGSSGLSLPALSGVDADAKDRPRARMLLQRVSETVANFCLNNSEGEITEGYVTLVSSGFVTDADALDGMLDEVTRTVRAIEAALRWHPAQSGGGYERPATAVALPPPPASSPESEAEPAQSESEEARAALPAGVESLVAELAEGRGDAGAFTIDRETAQEKMKAFQLAAPERYVLDLVQAAVLQGASQIDFEIDRDDMRLRFDGQPFTREDLETMYGSLFSAGDDGALAARRQLALGINAAAGFDPKLIRIEVGGAFLERRAGEAEEIGDRDAGDRLTRIHVKLRFAQKLTGIRERLEAVLREAVHYAEPAVRLNQERISFGLRSATAHGLVTVPVPGGRAVCGLSPDLGDDAEVHLVKDGVLVARHPLRNAGPGLLAVVDGGRLREDLSQGEIVRDAAYERAMATVRAAERAVVAKLVAELRESGQRRHFPDIWARRVLKRRVWAYTDPGAFRRGGAAEPLAGAPLWPTVAGRWVSMADLLAARDSRGAVTFAGFSLGGLRARPLPRSRASLAAALHLNVFSDRRDLAFLSEVFGGELRDVSDELWQVPRDETRIEALASEIK